MLHYADYKLKCLNVNVGALAGFFVLVDHFAFKPVCDEEDKCKMILTTQNCDPHHFFDPKEVPEGSEIHGQCQLDNNAISAVWDDTTLNSAWVDPTGLSKTNAFEVGNNFFHFPTNLSWNIDFMVAAVATSSIGGMLAVAAWRRAVNGGTLKLLAECAEEWKQ